MTIDLNPRIGDPSENFAIAEHVERSTASSVDFSRRIAFRSKLGNLNSFVPGKPVIFHFDGVPCKGPKP